MWSKKFSICLLLYGSLMVSSVLFAAGTQPSEKDCNEIIAYQPGGSNLSEARLSFNTELEILLHRCEVQKALPKYDNDSFHIRSFSKENGEEKLVYEVINFADEMRPTSSICTLVRSEKWNQVEQAFDALVSLDCTKPICTKNESPHCSDAHH